MPIVNKEELKSLREGKSRMLSVCIYCGLCVVFVYKAFNLYDTKNNGAIELDQVMKIVKSLGIMSLNDESIQELVIRNDENKDERIEFDEFVNIMTELISHSPPSSPTIQKKGNYVRSMSRHEIDELKACFEKFDKNGDGQISEEELKELMNEIGEKLNEKEIKDMMKDADTNKDGFIDFEEFKQLIPS